MLRQANREKDQQKLDMLLARIRVLLAKLEKHKKPRPLPRPGKEKPAPGPEQVIGAVEARVLAYDFSAQSRTPQSNAFPYVVSVTLGTSMRSTDASLRYFCLGEGVPCTGQLAKRHFSERLTPKNTLLPISLEAPHSTRNAKHLPYPLIP